MIEITETGATVITGEHIKLFSLMSLKQAVVLESTGLKMTRGASALSIAKKRYGLKGNRDKIVAQLQGMIEAFPPADKESEA
jgi:hypothetical protein